MERKAGERGCLTDDSAPWREASRQIENKADVFRRWRGRGRGGGSSVINQATAFLGHKSADNFSYLFHGRRMIGHAWTSVTRGPNLPPPPLAPYFPAEFASQKKKGGDTCLFFFIENLNSCFHYSISISTRSLSRFSTNTRLPRYHSARAHAKLKREVF